MTQSLTKAELLAKLEADPQFREVKSDEAIIIVGARSAASRPLVATGTSDEKKPDPA